MKPRFELPANGNGFAVAPIRPEVEALLSAEHKTRQARRLISPASPSAEVQRFAATTVIDEAIAQLVKARGVLNGVISPEGASS